MNSLTQFGVNLTNLTFGEVAIDMSVTVTFVGCGDAWRRRKVSNLHFGRCPSTRFVIDFGASSLIALNKMGINHNSIDTIVLTHTHGDHCGGIPFMLMDAMLGAKRRRPLTVGPLETEKRLDIINEVMMRVFIR